MATKKNPVEDGLLDTVQALKNETIRRRDRIVNPAWYEFLVIMLWIGGVASVGWIFWAGIQAGRASSPTPIQATVQSSPATPSVQQAGQGPMTTTTIKAALAKTREIITAADGIRGQVKGMAQAELPPPPPAKPASTPNAPKPSPSVWDINK